MGPPLAPRLLATGRQLTSTSRLTPYTQVRHAGFFSKLFGMGEKTDAKERKSITELLEEKRAERRSKADVSPQQMMPTAGGLSDSSIFGAGKVSKEAKMEEARLSKIAAEKASLAFRDPKRESWNWPRKHAWKMHVRRGRLTKEELIMRTERVHTCQSHFLKTSMKKLAPLARQIAGKKLEDAMAQMEFSLKGPSNEILEHLKEARDEAIITKGMDPKQMYVSQAWVGKGEYGFGMKRRARGRRDRLMLPYTRITVELKEEVTRTRIAREKEEKAARKPVWYQHPQKPIHGQQQYYQW